MADPSRTASVGDGLDGLKRVGLPASAHQRPTRRYAAAAHESPTDRVVNPLLADVRQALRQAPALAVGVIQDGAPELWNLLGAAVLAEPLVTTYHEAIDRYHLTERLGEVLRYLEPDASARGDRLSRWNESLDRNDNAIYRIRAWVRDRYADALARNDRILLEQLVPLIFDFFKKSLVIWGHRGLERCAVRTASPSRGSRRLFSST